MRVYRIFAGIPWPYKAKKKGLQVFIGSIFRQPDRPASFDGEKWWVQGDDGRWYIY
jgi:hypothetical protein